MKKILFILFAICSAQSFLFSQTGCIHGNCNNGLGTYKFDTGDMYTGNWIGGIRSGFGMYYWVDGGWYVGEMKDAKLEGYGVYSHPNGTLLIGKFEKGELTFTTSTLLGTGCISGNCTDGLGAFRFDDGALYAGEFKNGMRTGYGRMNWADGSYYYGEFKDGISHGSGAYYAKNATPLIGWFYENVYKGTNMPSEFLSTSTGNSSQKTQVTETAIFETAAANASKYDLCTTLQKVISEYTNSFKQLKSTKINQSDMSRVQWYSSIMSANSSYAGIDESTYSTPTWFNVMGYYADFSSAKNKYDEIIRKIKECDFNCCAMIQEEDNIIEDDYTSYLTLWLPLSTKAGYTMGVYENLTIEAELYESELNEWIIEIRVFEFENIDGE